MDTQPIGDDGTAYFGDQADGYAEKVVTLDQSESAMIAETPAPGVQYGVAADRDADDKLSDL